MRIMNKINLKSTLNSNGSVMNHLGSPWKNTYFQILNDHLKIELEEIEKENYFSNLLVLTMNSNVARIIVLFSDTSSEG